MARLADEKELFPYRPHWSYDPQGQRRARAYNRSKVKWQILASLEDI
jgi:hypothetical protein